MIKKSSVIAFHSLEARYNFFSLFLSISSFEQYCLITGWKRKISRDIHSKQVHLFICLYKKSSYYPWIFEICDKISWENTKEMYEWILSNKINIRVDKVKLFDSCRIIDMWFKMPQEVKEYCEWHLRISKKKSSNSNIFLSKWVFSLGSFWHWQTS